MRKCCRRPTKSCVGRLFDEVEEVVVRAGPLASSWVAAGRWRAFARHVRPQRREAGTAPPTAGFLEPLSEVRFRRPAIGSLEPERRRVKGKAKSQLRLAAAVDEFGPQKIGVLCLERGRVHAQVPSVGPIVVRSRA